MSNKAALFALLATAALSLSLLRAEGKRTGLIDAMADRASACGEGRASRELVERATDAMSPA